VRYVTIHLTTQHPSHPRACHCSARLPASNECSMVHVTGPGTRSSITSCSRSHLLEISAAFSIRFTSHNIHAGAIVICSTIPLSFLFLFPAKLSAHSHDVVQLVGRFNCNVHIPPRICNVDGMCPVVQDRPRYTSKSTGRRMSCLRNASQAPYCAHGPPRSPRRTET